MGSPKISIPAKTKLIYKEIVCREYVLGKICTLNSTNYIIERLAAGHANQNSKNSLQWRSFVLLLLLLLSLLDPMLELRERRELH